MQQRTELQIVRPDDWHLHLRDGAMMRTVLPCSSEVFGRALIMPNLKPPVRSVQEATDYRAQILDCLPAGHAFHPLMTLYLTDRTSKAEIRKGKQDGLITAVKLYPLGATTNSEAGVSDLRRIYPVLEVLEDIGLPLSVHGEVSDPDVDIFDREAVFIERILEPLRRDFPELKVVLEHVSSRIGVEYVLSAGMGLAATITPHHLLVTRSQLFAGGLNPHLYCLPVAKRETDRQAIRRAAVSGDPRFFFGSDSAPHRVQDKERFPGAAGIFNIPTAVPLLAQVFEERSALEHLEAFLSRNGARFYGLPENPDRITLQKAEAPLPMEAILGTGEDRVRIFQADRPLSWRVLG